MVKLKLTKDDLNILRELQRDAKQSMRLLSKKTNLPITTLHRRIKRLEINKVIKGYTAVVDQKAVGVDVTAFMLATLEYRKDVNKIAASISKIPGMQEIHYTTGEWDLIMKLKVPTLDNYYKFSAETALQLDGIQNTSGIIVPNTFKETTILQI